MKQTALLFFVFLCCIPAFSQSKQVSSIEITSTWGGLGDAQKSQMSIKRNKVGDFTSSGKTIDRNEIESLLSSLGQPTLSEPSMENLGITSDWLLANARRCVEGCVNGYIAMAYPEQKQLFVDSYTNVEIVRPVVSGLFRGGWTDDYPRITIQIFFENGEQTSVSSDSQSLFMIPWKIESASGNRTTYDVGVSAAVVSFLPKKFTNVRRLKGERLAEEIAASLLRRIEPQWDKLQVLARLKDDIPYFVKNYEIVSMEINSNHDSDFGTAWNAKGPIEKNLHIVLRKLDYPKAFALKVILPVEKDRLVNVDTFDANIGRYLKLIDSVQWLREYVAKSESPIWLRFVENRSLSRKGMQSFAADMKALGKDDVAAKVEKVQDDVALVSFGGGLEYYQSFWLILPDGSSVVWRHYYVSPIPGLRFSPKECAQNRSNTKACVGELISGEGKVISM